MQSTVKEFKPLIVAFCCNWCSYAGADLAGSSRLSMVPLRLIPRIIVRRLLIWLVPRVGFGRLGRR